MKKFWQFFKTNFEMFLEYRADLAISFLLKLAVFSAFVFIWSQIVNEGNNIKGYSLSRIIFYYLGTQVLDGLYTSQIAKDLRENILSGSLSTKLVRPFKIPIYFFCKNLARVVSETLLHLVMTIPVFIIMPDLLDSMVINFQTSFQFVLGCFLSMIFSFNLFLTVGFIAFWTKQAHGLQMVVKNAARFFVGDLIPLDLLPVRFQNIIFLSPFPYILYFPVKVLMGDITSEVFFKSVGIITLWIIIFVVLNSILWKKGLKQYESVGI